MPVHSGHRRLRDLLLGQRRLELDPTDLHRLDGERLPWAGRDLVGAGRQLRSARRADRNASELLRERARPRRGPGCRLRAAARPERAVLVEQRLAAVLRQPDVELQRRPVRVRIQGFRGDRRLPPRQPGLRGRESGSQHGLEAARDREQAERGAVLRPRDGCGRRRDVESVLRPRLRLQCRLPQSGDRWPS